MGHLVIGKPPTLLLNIEEIESVYDSEYLAGRVIVRMKSGTEHTLYGTTVEKVLLNIREPQS